MDFFGEKGELCVGFYGFRLHILFLLSPSFCVSLSEKRMNERSINYKNQSTSDESCNSNGCNSAGYSWFHFNRMSFRSLFFLECHCIYFSAIASIHILKSVFLWLFRAELKWQQKKIMWWKIRFFSFRFEVIWSDATTTCVLLRNIQSGKINLSWAKLLEYWILPRTNEWKKKQKKQIIHGKML